MVQWVNMIGETGNELVSEEFEEGAPRYIDCPECGQILRHRPGDVYGCTCGVFIKAEELECDCCKAEASAVEEKNEQT